MSKLQESQPWTELQYPGSSLVFLSFVMLSENQSASLGDAALEILQFDHRRGGVLHHRIQ